jgi:hypothetical protein
MTPIDRDQRPLEKRDDAIAGVVAELEQLSLRHAGLPQAALDLCLEQLRLRLRDPAEGIRVHAEESEDAGLASADAHEQTSDADHGRVVGARRLVGTRPVEPDRLM